MRYRQHRDDLLSIGVPGSQNDGARPILDALLPPLPMLFKPEIGIANDKSGNGLRQRHAKFLVELVVESRGLAWRIGAFDRRDILRREIAQTHDAPVAAF